MIEFHGWPWPLHNFDGFYRKDFVGISWCMGTGAIMVHFSSINLMMQLKKRATVWSGDLLNKLEFIYHLVTTQCVFLGWVFFLTTVYSVYGLNICQLLQALIGTGIITRNVEVDLRAIHASSLISESLIELLRIKVVSVSNSGVGLAVLQWQVICWGEDFWQIWHFFIFLRNAYLSQGMLLPIACHGPYAITCWFFWQIYGCVWQFSNVVTQEWQDCHLWWWLLNMGQLDGTLCRQPWPTSFNVNKVIKNTTLIIRPVDLVLECFGVLRYETFSARDKTLGRDFIKSFQIRS